MFDSHTEVLTHTGWVPLHSDGGESIAQLFLTSQADIGLMHIRNFSTSQQTIPYKDIITYIITHEDISFIQDPNDIQYAISVPSKKNPC